MTDIWRKIATAPLEKDVLLYIPGWGLEVGQVKYRGNSRVCEVACVRGAKIHDEINASHWYPLPKDRPNSESVER